MLFRWVNMIYPYNQQAGGLSWFLSNRMHASMDTFIYRPDQKEERFELPHIQLKVKSAI